MTGHSTGARVRAALRAGYAAGAPGAPVDQAGYVANHLHALLPAVAPADFETDLRAGDGNELESKLRAIHSSSALAVNCFAPFRTRLGDLHLCGLRDIDALRFECKCPTGLRRGTPPHLDLLAEGPQGVIGVESKLTEYLVSHRARFSAAYADEIGDWRREQGYFAEMQRLRDRPSAYRHLDAAQLVKHAFGLGHVFGGRPLTLLYLYWEPRDPDCDPVFAAHRREIAEFAERVAGSRPAFRALSYTDLWAGWRNAAPDWLGRHLDDLERRYLVSVGARRF